jgi:GNAT superfamily N-acetyltransferase
MRATALARRRAPVRIVEATTPRHVDAAARLFRDYAAALGHDFAAGGHFAAEIASLPGPYAPPSGALLLAYVEDAPAGVVGLQQVPRAVLIPGVGADGAGEMKRLYVRPQFRGAGIGRELVLRTEREARLRSHGALVLTTSLELFPLAQRLYEDLGYGPTAPYRNDMPWPGVRWMRREL